MLLLIFYFGMEFVFVFDVLFDNDYYGVVIIDD